MLSKTVHQIWVGSRQPPTQLIATWQQMTAEFGWEYQLWRSADIEDSGLQNKAIFPRQDAEFCLMRYVEGAYEV